MTDARIQVPAQVRRGDTFEVKLLISHPMESGFNYTHDGKPIPRNAIRSVTCGYNGTEVFRIEPSSGVAANPLFAFYVTARASWCSSGSTTRARTPVRARGWP